MYRIGDIELQQFQLTTNSKQLFRSGNVNNGHRPVPWYRSYNFSPTNRKFDAAFDEK